MTEHQAIESAVAELVDQPDLFSGETAVEAGALAVDAPLVFAAGTVRRQVTGERVTRDQGRALVIGALKIRGMSNRKIAAAVQCDPRTIDRVMERLEAAGVVPSLKERLAGKVGRLSESVSDSLADLVESAVWDRDTTSALKGLAVALGITTEKGLLLTGQATEIRANVPPGGVVARPEELMAWVTGAPVQTSGPAGPADLESDVSAPNAPGSPVTGAVPTGAPTAAPLPPVVLDVWPPDPRAPGSDRAAGAKGGEGVGRARPHRNQEGSGAPRNFEDGGQSE